MSEPAAVLTVSNLGVQFPTEQGVLEALRQVTFEVANGEFVCILGPSGCGKTSLLRVLAGLLQPNAGEVKYSNRALAGPQAEFGIIFQKANLMPWRTVRANVCLPLEIQGRSKEEQVEISTALLQLVGLTGFEEVLPRDLSGGMAQRVAIARALAHNPDLLLMDEPFGQLDALTREQMGAELLRIWQAQQKTVVMVTHSIGEALYLSDRVIVLSPRPGQVRLNLEVPLPRPRQMSMRYTDIFGELAGKIRTTIAQG